LAVSQAGGDDPLVLAVRIEGEDVSARLLSIPGGAQEPGFNPFLQCPLDERLRKHIHSDIRSGADGEKQRPAIRREDDVARPVMTQGMRLTMVSGVP
jgi:hypothetical protein